MPRRRRSSKRLKKKAPSTQLKVLSWIISLILLFLSITLPVMYVLGLVGATLANVGSLISLSLFLPSVAFSYLLTRNYTLSSIVSMIGLSRDKLTLKNIGMGVLLYLIILLIGLLIGIFSVVTNIPLPTNVDQVLAGLPLYFLVFSFVITPINEEIFFRGFMIRGIRNLFNHLLSYLSKPAGKKIVVSESAAMWVGIIVSALIFALFHASYNSISELVAALAFGLLAGYIFKRTNSLYPSIIAHAIVNLIAVYSFLNFAMLIHI